MRDDFPMFLVGWLGGIVTVIVLHIIFHDGPSLYPAPEVEPVKETNFYDELKSLEDTHTDSWKSKMRALFEENKPLLKEKALEGQLSVVLPLTSDELCVTRETLCLSGVRMYASIERGKCYVTWYWYSDCEE